MGSKFVDLTGQRFGSLVVLGIDGNRCARTKWKCQCDCGAVTSPLGFALKSGNTRSCGNKSIHRKGVSAPWSRTHGYSKTRTYQIYQGMRDRCEKPSDHAYARYGGRGIKVCERWRSFEIFLADMGEAPEGLSLERRDNEKGYAPDNCYWATAEEQGNNKRNNRVLHIGDHIETVAQFAKRTGLKYATAYRRMVLVGKAPRRDELFTVRAD